MFKNFLEKSSYFVFSLLDRFTYPGFLAIFWALLDTF
jgi:hypothetical protein